jgi:hypothetical protein
VTPDIYSGSFEEENLFEETHTFGDNWEENTPVGVGKFMLNTGEGLYDDRAIGQFAALRNSMNTLQLVALLLAGDTAGDQTIMLNGDYVIKYNRTPSKDGLTKASAEHAITGERLFGGVLNGMTAVTTAGNTESTPEDVMFPDPAVNILTSAVSGDLITTQSAHGLAVGDYVFISGHTGSTPSINSTAGTAGSKVATVPTSTTFTLDGVTITVGGTGGTAKRFKSVVISTSNSSEVVTTATPHGLVVGDYVFVVGHSDSALNTAAYGSEQVLTVPSTTTFTVTGPLTGGTGGRMGIVTQASAKADLHVPALTLGGYTSFDVKVRHSDDNSTWADAATFTAVTVAGTAERKTITGLKRFRAIAWTWTGTGSSQSAVGFVHAERP